ncbi:DUF3147 family protein [Pseudalkalibacillus sp. SCS-8]|uniref:DUF3147 family protein n=1 Tax=Pseudalkalibacillus nanhaiensis TaxID=3115291 RepID=UPI0032D9CD77
MYIIVKILVSALVIGLVTEIARRFPTYGGILAALPLVSLLSIIWLSIQGEGNMNLSKFALSVLWGFPATAVLLVIVYFSLKHSLHLYTAILLGLGGWMIFLFIQENVIHYVRTNLYG